MEPVREIDPPSILDMKRKPADLAPSGCDSTKPTDIVYTDVVNGSDSLYGPFRMCIASSINGPAVCNICTLWFCYIGFCGYDRTLLDRAVLTEYPFCGGCNPCGVSAGVPVLEVPCCIAAPLFPIVFPLFSLISYCSSLSAPGLCFPPMSADGDDCGGGCRGKNANVALYYAETKSLCDSEFEGFSITSVVNCCGDSYGEI